jgi:D-inositol-3-phosphate glycosyltransferase
LAPEAKGFEEYWKPIQTEISRPGLVIARIQRIPDEDVKMYFKVADVLALPYVEIFQSGVPFLAYNFGLPVIATDVGSLREDIIEGRTGFVSRAKDSLDLTRAIGQYFESELFRDLEIRREGIKRYANERYAWEKLPKLPRKCMKN